MTGRKTIFVAFAIEDEYARNFLKGHAVNAKCPYDYIDMSVKEAYESDWKTKVETRIRRSDGVIALISKNSLTSSGQKWEIDCAKRNGVPVLPIWISSDDRAALPGVTAVPWTWDNVANFIDRL